MAYTDNNSHGFIQLIRSNEVENLIKSRPSAYILLTLIALRARRTRDRSFDGLNIGEAYIGDHNCYGASAREYRTDKKLLAEYGIATFRTTNRGTIARLVDTTIFNINPEETTSQKTRKRQEHDNQQTTNNNDKKENNENMKPLPQRGITHKVNPILDDPIFQRLLTARSQSSDAAFRVREACEKTLNNRYPIWKHASDWEIARSILNGQQ